MIMAQKNHQVENHEYVCRTGWIGSFEMQMRNCDDFVFNFFLKS